MRFGVGLILAATLVSCPRSVPHDAGFIEHKGDPVRWAQLPVFVAAESWIDGRERQAIEDACAFWNARVGFVFIVLPPDAPVIAADVIVTQTNEDAHGDTLLLWDETATLQLAYVSLPGLASDWTFEHITRHELGHALGLAHDQRWDSIMVEYLRRGFPYDVTENDVALFK